MGDATVWDDDLGGRSQHTDVGERPRDPGLPNRAGCRRSSDPKEGLNMSVFEVFQLFIIFSVLIGIRYFVSLSYLYFFRPRWCPASTGG